MKLRTLFALAALALLPLAHRPLDSQGPTTAAVFPRNPVVVYEFVATSVLGDSHAHLIAFADGHVSFSQSASPILPDSTDLSVSLDLDPADVADLAERLRRAGAAVLGDAVTTGLPVTTVTLLTPDETSLAHSFSFTPFSGPHVEVQSIINEFLGLQVTPNLP